MGLEAFPHCFEKTIENSRISECVFVDRRSGTEVDDGENVLRPHVRYRVFGNERRTVEMDQQSKGSAPCCLARNEDLDGLCQQTVNGTRVRRGDPARPAARARGCVPPSATGSAAPVSAKVPARAQARRAARRSETRRLRGDCSRSSLCGTQHASGRTQFSTESNLESACARGRASCRSHRVSAGLGHRRRDSWHFLAARSCQGAVRAASTRRYRAT